MKTQLNEIKRMQQLAGLLNENENQSTNKYLTVDEDGDYQLNSKAITDYLKSAIDPKEIENVDIFMNDDEGFEESSTYFFDSDEDPATTTEKEVEDWAKQEMSYYLFSKPDEFPVKENIEEAKKLASKEDKIQVIKEWIWFNCNEGQAKDDIIKYNKMVDDYFTNKEDVAKEDFKKIYAKVSEKYGVGDVGADWENFEVDWKDVQTGTLVNPGKKY